MLLQNNLQRLSTELSLTLYAALVDSFDILDRIYVNSNGDDVSGDGSKQNPYASLDHVKTLPLDGKAIILEAEEYVTSWCEDYAHQYRIIGQPFAGATLIGKGFGTVIVPDIPSGARDGVFLGSNGTTKVYGIHFKRDNGGSSTNYNIAVCSNGGGSSTSTYPSSYMTAINCVFEETNANGNMSLSYFGNINECTFNHCSFIAGNWLSNYSGTSYLAFNNCAFTGTPILGSATAQNIIQNIIFDGVKHLKEEAGVYSGISKWAEEKPSREILIESFAISNRIYVETTGSDASGDGTIDNPYQSLNKVRDLPGGLAGKIILPGSGVFEIDYTAQGQQQQMFSDAFNGAHILGKGLTTIVRGVNDTGVRDIAFIGTTTVGSEFSNFVMEGDNGGRITNYTTTCFCGTSSNYVYARLNNVVLKELNANGHRSFTYNNPYDSDIVVSNSTFLFGKNTTTYTGGATITLKNCAFDYVPDYGSTYGGGTSEAIDCAEGVTVDGDYRIVTAETYEYFRMVICKKQSTYLEISEIGFVSDEVTHPTQALTSETTPAPYVVTKSYEYNSTYSAWKAFDKGISGWNTYNAAMPQWIGLNLGTGNGIKLDAFQITINHSSAAHLPEDIQIYGSNDGGTTLDFLGSVSGLGTEILGGQINSFDLSSEPNSLVGVYSGVYSWHGYSVRQSIIEPFAQSSRIYVTQDGSDINGDGSENNPYASIDHALIEKGAPGKVLIIGSGTFQVSPHSSVYVRTILGTQFNGMTVIGIPGQTTIQSSYTYTGGSHDYASFIGPGVSNTAFHWLIVERENAGTTTNYKCPLISNDHNVPALGSAYNCVFKELNANSNISLGYNNGNNSNFTLHNCSIIASNWLSSYSGTSGLNAQNCAFTGTPNYGSASQSGSQENTLIAPEYSFRNMYGVYSGSYGWDEVRQVDVAYSYDDPVIFSLSGLNLSGEFEYNQIGAAFAGGLTHQSEGGFLDGPYYTGWSDVNYITTNTIDADNTSYSNWITLSVAVKFTGADIGGTSAACGKNIFGKTGGSIYTSWGLSDGKIAVESSGGSGGVRGVSLINDDQWHRLSYQQAGQYAWNMWVDGILEGQAHIGGTNDINRIGRSYHNANYPPAPDEMDGLIIQKGRLANKELRNIAELQGFNTKTTQDCIYLDAFTDDATLNSYNFAGRPLGEESSDRLIIACVATGGVGSDTTSVTIAGVSATKAVNVFSSGVDCSIWFASIPTGTSGDIDITANGTNHGCAMTLLALYGLSSHTPHVTASSDAGGILDNSLNLPEDAVIISAASNWSSSSVDATFDFFELEKLSDIKGGKNNLGVAIDVGKKKAVSYKSRCELSGSTSYQRLVSAVFV